MAKHLFQKGNKITLGRKQPLAERKKRSESVKLAHKNKPFGFIKGIKVWNKDLKGIHLSPKTEFKKGCIGALNASWKGGTTTGLRKLRVSMENKMWRKSCLERDDWTCQITGIRGGELAVHHINNFAEYPELRFALDNGITMRKELHKEFHQIYGYRNNTRGQLEEFINNKRKI